MGQPVSKSDIAAARTLCFDALADTNYPISAKRIAAWKGRNVASSGVVVSNRAIQCALRSMFINGYVDRERSGNEYVYTLLPECAHLGEDCDTPDHCRCFCHSCVDAFDAWNNGED